MRQKFNTAKIPYGENSERRKIHMAKTAYGGNSLKRKFHTAKNSTSKIHLSLIPRATVLATVTRMLIFNFVSLLRFATIYISFSYLQGDSQENVFLIRLEQK